MINKETRLPEGILEVTPVWPAEVFIQRHVQAMQNEGFTVSIASRHSKRPVSNQASVQNDAIQMNIAWIPDFDKLPIIKKVEALLRYGLAARFKKPMMSMRQRTLLGFFTELKPKLIHFHNAQLAVSLSWLCQELKIPYTVSLRGADIQEIPLRSDKIFESTQLILARASGIHTVCKAFNGSPLVQGISTTTIYTVVPVPDKLTGYNLNIKDGYHFLSTGRIHWRKGYPDLLIALRGLLDSGLNARLTIVGVGPDEARVQFWIKQLDLKGRVNLPGKLNFEQIQRLLKNAHAYVQASCAEGLSNALAEAMANGCPVFATDVAGTGEIIRDNVNGFLLEPFAPERWIKKLLLITDQERLQKVRLVAYQEAKRYFDAETHSQKFIDFFRKAINCNSFTQRIVSGVIEREEPNIKRIVDQSPDRPEMIVCLPWEWQYGTDQILRAIAPMARRGELILKLYGKGTAEDELRYIANEMGLDQRHVVCKVLETPKSFLTYSEYPENLKLKVDCPNQAKPIWRFWDGRQETISAFGDTAKLLKIVKRFTKQIST